MTETTIALIKQNARWDAGEESWELNIPFNTTFRTPLNDEFDIVANEFTKWANDHDLDYEHIMVIGSHVCVSGLRFKS